jgi:hypothetical protein
MSTNSNKDNFNPADTTIMMLYFPVIQLIPVFKVFYNI